MAYERSYAYATITAESVRRDRIGAALSQLLAESTLELAGACFSGPKDEPMAVFEFSGDHAATVLQRVEESVRTRLGGDSDPVVDIAESAPADLRHDVDPAQPDQTLVLLKPDNFEYPSIRPGALLDHFAQTGLHLAAMKVHHMSVGEAEEFYAPVLSVLEEAFKNTHGSAACDFLDAEFEESLSDAERGKIADIVGPVMGRRRWETLVEFMSGSRPSQVPEDKKRQPGTRKCLALVYRGENAIDRIRSILGPTDPAEAPAGTVRREFGRALMINAAHASDSPANVSREMRIVRMSENPLVTRESSEIPAALGTRR